MNQLIVAQPAVNPAPVATAAPAEQPMSLRMLHAMGYESYQEGRPYSDMLTTAERNGWLAANRAQGEMLTDGYADKVGF